MPARSAIAKEDRLSIRIPREIKKHLVRAANIRGVTLGDFVIANTAKAADDIIQSHQLLELSERDYNKLMEALDNPPAPNSALMKAAMDYRKAVESGELKIDH